MNTTSRAGLLLTLTVCLAPALLVAQAPPLGPEFRVDAQTGTESSPSIASRGDGSFVVVWTSTSQSGSGLDVLGQRFDGSGEKTGDAFGVGKGTAASLAVSKSGDFVVVSGTSTTGYYSHIQYGSIDGQRFGSSGSRVGSTFPVNSHTTGTQPVSSVAMDRVGNFVVVWQGKDGSEDGIFGQRFDSSGAKTGSEFMINTYTSGSQDRPVVAFSKSGDSIVVWEGDSRDASGFDVFAQRFDRTGARVGSEFKVNIDSTDVHSLPKVADDGRGFAVVWVGSGGHGIFGRRQNLNPHALAVDSHPGAGTASDLNGVMEPGETVLVETSWSNVGDAAFADLTGTASYLSGPEGLYLLHNASADYGAMPPGSLGECGRGSKDSCYLLTVGGTSRPATHWDADLEENLSSGAQHWKLHLGDSFTDVPRTQPFYAKIETLLHNGITSGCNATQYCPNLPVLREQIAIFIARALAGSGENVPNAGARYNCTPGGTSLFTDVAPTDIFCKHVHYLAGQKVMPGCGGSLFCSREAVTRDSMASFIANAIAARSSDKGVPASYTDPVTALSYSCDAASPDFHFTDVPVSSPSCKPIHYLWAKGIVSGCSATEFCPSDAVNRGAMAKFITNGFGLKLYKP